LVYPTGVDVQLTSPIICGQVRVDGAPVGGVELSISGPGGTQTTTTDNNGVYSFAASTQGVYTITETDPPNTISVSDTDGANDNTIIVTINDFEYLIAMVMG